MNTDCEHAYSMLNKLIAVHRITLDALLDVNTYYKDISLCQHAVKSFTCYYQAIIYVNTIE